MIIITTITVLFRDNVSSDSPSIYGSTALCWTFAAFFSFLIFLHSRQDPFDRGLVRRKDATSTQNKRTQTSMPRVGFQPTIPGFERANPVHALDSAATVIGYISQ
jgi:hypothetical protein